MNRKCEFDRNQCVFLPGSRNRCDFFNPYAYHSMYGFCSSKHVDEKVNVTSMTTFLGLIGGMMDMMTLQEVSILCKMKGR